jgi:hypothetical protein
VSKSKLSLGASKTSISEHLQTTGRQLTVMVQDKIKKSTYGYEKVEAREAVSFDRVYECRNQFDLQLFNE